MKKQIKPGFFGVTATADAFRNVFDIKNEQYLASGKKADVVFFGDSITEHWELELYFNPNTLKINRGIGGDTTVFAAMRFEADALQIDAENIVILLGINDLIKTAPDLWWRRPGADIEKILSDIEKSFIDMLKKCSGKKVYICSILPQNIAPPFDREVFKSLVLKANEILKKLCDEFNAEYVDYYSKLQKDDLLPDDLSHDGIHPNGKCYKIMADLLKDRIRIL